MVKFYESIYSYDYSFPAVTLAYFLRYPNPFATHVLSTDTISQSIDPTTGRLQTLRIHRKSSRLPPAVLKLLPSSVLRSGSVGRNGRSESYILETSEIDVKEGWMKTESRNLDWTGILSVVERQLFKSAQAQSPRDGAEERDKDLLKGNTDVVTTVMFRSRLGDRLRARAGRAKEQDEETEKRGLLSTWSTRGIQRSIEAIASRRTETQLGKAKEGMMVVLERLRQGGLGGVMDGMRSDEKMVVRE